VALHGGRVRPPCRRLLLVRQATESWREC